MLVHALQTLTLLLSWRSCLVRLVVRLTPSAGTGGAVLGSCHLQQLVVIVKTPQVSLLEKALHCVLTIRTQLRQNLVTVDSRRGGQCPRAVSHLLRCLTLESLGLQGKTDVVEDLLRLVADRIVTPVNLC